MAVLILSDTTLLVKIENLVREDTGAAIVSGVTVTARIYRPPDLTTPIVEVELDHTGSGDWEKIISAITGLTVHERLDVEWEVDGGVALKRTWWARNVQVHESRPEA